jgi:nitroreductase
MPTLDLSAEQVLSTTRSVRKRLDFSRPVEPELIRECIEIAMQAPTGSNAQRWHFVVVTDPAKRRGLADLYRKGWELYTSAPQDLEKLAQTRPDYAATMARVVSSSQYLADHMQDAPVLLLPCIFGRCEGQPSVVQAGLYGSILPAAWSFMLAARNRGLGSAWTTLHLFFEREAAELLGIPYERITQTAMIPVAYSLGTDFKPAPREPLDKVLHWDTW